MLEIPSSSLPTTWPSAGGEIPPIVGKPPRANCVSIPEAPATACRRWSWAIRPRTCCSSSPASTATPDSEATDPRACCGSGPRWPAGMSPVFPISLRTRNSECC
ncbi:hypothetical protein MPTK1_4g07650 [Marchantia polymorpha subsp. ruderalis]